MQSSEILIENLDFFGGPAAAFFVVRKIAVRICFRLLAGIEQPRFSDQWWLAWIGVAPLLVLLRGCSTRMEAFSTGLSFGIGYYLVSLSWYWTFPAPLAWS